jgi:hypothetical protein
MMRSVLRTPALWTALLLPALPVAVHAATARGKIERSAGYPVSYMKVTLKGQKAEIGSVFTGSDGFYYFKNIPAGIYTLTIWSRKDRPASYRIQIREPYTEIPVVRIP